jgi:AcrR family transcriptional regulator
VNPRQRDRGATTSALQTAARKVFADKGYDAATTKEVALEAGVSEQLIQRYFGGKAGLLLSIMENYTTADRAGAFGTPPPGKTLAAEIENFLLFNLEREVRAGDFARVAIYRSIVDPKIAAEIARMFTDSREPFVHARLTALRDNRQIAAGANLKAMAHVLSTLSFALAFNDQLVFGRDRAELRRTIKAFARTLAKGMSDS